MSAKSTRSKKPLEETEEATRKVAKAPAIFKVFYVAEELLNETTRELRLERFFHPGHNSQALFITHANKVIMEVMEFKEPRRSWLINSEISSNGRIYVTTPVDTTFLALHHIRKHCGSKALELETIHDEKDASVSRLLKHFVRSDMLSCIADVKAVGDMTFYKYNHIKTLAWLALKSKNLAAALKETGIHCGNSAISQYYKRSEKFAEEIQDVDYLRYACDIVGGYLAIDLHEELKSYLNIPKEKKIEETKDESKKRKSLTNLKAAKNKKLKTEENDDEAEEAAVNEDTMESDNATAKLKNSSLLDDSNDEIRSEARPTPLKERVLTTKEKALAKSAKGTKSIASFFKK